MLNRAPKYLPPLALLLDDLGNPRAQAIADMLGVSPRTVERWLAAGEAPRPAALALFWLTRWGMSVVDAEAANAAAMYAGLARARSDELARLRAEFARVLLLMDSGAANQPTLAVMPRLWRIEA